MIRRELLPIGLAVAFALGFATSRYLRREPDVKIEYKDKVIKELDVITKYKIITKPDGTKIEEGVKVDKSKTARQIEYGRTERKLSQWRATAGYDIGLSDLKGRPWHLGVERRVLGPIWLGGAYSSNMGVIATLSMEF